jgi:hypothetical protein
VASTVYIEADTIATSQPAPNATFGRNAVWADSIAVYHGEGLTDSTGNGQDLVEEGSPSIVSGKIGNAYQTSGVNNSGGNAYIATLNSGVVSVSITSWLKRDASGYESAVTLANNTTLDNSAGEYLAISADNPNEYRASFRGVSNAYRAAVVNNAANNVYQMVTASYIDSSNEISVNVQGVGNSVTSANSNSVLYNKVILGRENNTAGSSDLFAWDGLINQVNLRGVNNFPSANRLTTEYNNQNNPSTFWSSSAWEDQDSSIVVAATLGLISYGSKNSVVTLDSSFIANATLGLITYASKSATVTLSEPIGINATLGLISYNSNNAFVTIGTGQVIGTVTSSFKPDQITVTFKV